MPTAQLEVINSDFPDRYFAEDPDGTLYRARAVGTESADLRYEGPDADAYRDTYSQRTNDRLDDWSDLIQLTDVINNTPDDQYVERVSEVLDLPQWLRFLAMDALLGNRETGLSVGTGDNYWLYRGLLDTRFQLVPHDLDTLMGRGRVGQPNRSLFTYTAVPAFERLLTHPQIVPLYYQAFLDLLEEVFRSETIDPLLDQLLGGFVAQGEINQLKEYVARRIDGVIAQIPQEFRISSALPITSGYHRTTQPVTELVGTADAVRTQSVLVNGLPAEWSPFTREWSVRSQGDGRTEILVAAETAWHYRDDGSDLETRWRRHTFDDSEWLVGDAPLGYGKGDEATIVGYGPNPNDKYITTYFRRIVSVADPELIQDLTLRLQRDDGAIVFLNGVEIARSNMPADPVDFQTVASSWVGGGLENQFHSITVDRSLIQPGDNLLAVEVHQRSPIDSDLRFDLSLEATVGQTTGGVALRPGINRVLVQAFDGPQGTGQEIDRDYVDIWYDGAAGIDQPYCDQLRQTVQLASAQLTGGTLEQDTTLAPCGPAYRITSPLIVPTGVTLTVLPGTTLFFDTGAGIRVEGGRLLAEGTTLAPIRFTRPPGSNATWNGIQLIDTALENRLSHAVLEYAVTGDGMVGLEGSRIEIHDSTFDNTDRFRIRSVNSSLIVRDSVFTDIFAPNQPPTTDNQSEHIWGSGILPGGQLLIESNRFGTTKGHNDAVDFDGAERPGPIPVIRDNVFDGSGDDALDLECDAHIEGNLFRNVVKDQFNSASGDANAISAGAGRQFVVTRNVFQQVDHAVQVKDDAFLTFQHNTVYDAYISAIYFDLDERTPGRGAFVTDSIFAATAEAFASVEETTDLVVRRSVVPPEALQYGEQNLAVEARFIDAEQGDFRLRPGSAAKASGQNGWDRGAIVPSGVSLAGEPATITASSDATLVVGGPGLTHYRFRVNQQPWSDERPIETPIVLTALPNGTYQVEVVGRNSAGLWQSLDRPTQSRSWTVDRLAFGLRLNEILAANRTTLNVAGEYPDMVELYNAGNEVVDLSGMSLTDNEEIPRKFVFPPNSQIAAGQYLLVTSGPSSPEYPLALGFGLQREGEGLYLFDAVEQGGELLDAIQFGLQIPDYSLGRTGPDLRWKLTIPTLGGANIAQPTGDPSTLSINEWLTRGDVRVNDDYIELFNPDPLPVALGDLSWTDDPIGRPHRFTIPSFSYVAGNDYAVFRADRNTQLGADHLPFRLGADQGHLALIDSNHTVIDQVLYHWQTIDATQGRFPDGADRIDFLTIPTPGAANVLRGLQRSTVLAVDAPWHYRQSGDPPPANWKEPDFDDSLWNVGQGVLAAEEGELPSTIRTPLSIGALAYYFRGSFQLEDPSGPFELQMRSLVDDGAVFYLNGTEFLRSGMPEGAVDENTRANRGVGNATWEGPFILPHELLQPGENVLAVEVHQISPTNSDVVFGMLLESVQNQSHAAVDQALALLDGLRITEIMYHPADTGNTEFLELQNVSDEPLELNGVRLEGGIEYQFGTHRLEPGELTVVVGNRSEFRARYGDTMAIAGEYRGGLGNGSDEIQMMLPAPYDVQILSLQYDDSWYRLTDGEGFSLTLADPDTRVSDVRYATAWRRSREPGGTPGTPDPAVVDFNADGISTLPDLQILCDAVRIGSQEWKYDLDLDDKIGLGDVGWWLEQLYNTSFGDADLNGTFDSQDIILVYQRGRYEEQGVASVTWDEGDWDCDGRFTSSDLVLAFQTGRYEL